MIQDTLAAVIAKSQTAPSLSFLPAAVAVLGMAWHTYIKFRDVQRRPGQAHLRFADYALDKSRMGASFLGLCILAAWVFDVPLPLLGAVVAAAVRAAGASDLADKLAGFNSLRDFLPYHVVTALAVGYMMDSLVKELVKKVPLVGRLAGIKLQRKSTPGADADDLTISEPMPAVPPPPGFDGPKEQP